MTSLVSRRQLLVGAAGIAGTVGLTLGSPATRAAGRARLGVTYELRATEFCCCSACHSHAANKIFATRAAAEQGRAHVGCQCVVRRGPAIAPESWRSLFGSPEELIRTSVDRRRTSTEKALRSSRPSLGHS